MPERYPGKIFQCVFEDMGLEVGIEIKDINRDMDVDGDRDRCKCRHRL